MSVTPMLPQDPPGGHRDSGGPPARRNLAPAPPESRPLSPASPPPCHRSIHIHLILSHFQNPKWQGVSFFTPLATSCFVSPCKSTLYKHQHGKGSPTLSTFIPAVRFFCGIVEKDILFKRPWTYNSGEKHYLRTKNKCYA